MTENRCEQAPRQNRSFTLIELIVVILIVALISAATVFAFMDRAQ